MPEIASLGRAVATSSASCCDPAFARPASAAALKERPPAPGRRRPAARRARRPTPRCGRRSSSSRPRIPSGGHVGGAAERRDASRLWRLRVLGDSRRSGHQRHPPVLRRRTRRGARIRHRRAARRPRSTVSRAAPTPAARGHSPSPEAGPGSGPTRQGATRTAVGRRDVVISRHASTVFVPRPPDGVRADVGAGRRSPDALDRLGPAAAGAAAAPGRAGRRAGGAPAAVSSSPSVAPERRASSRCVPTTAILAGSRR